MNGQGEIQPCKYSVSPRTLFLAKRIKLVKCHKTVKRVQRPFIGRISRCLWIWNLIWVSSSVKGDNDRSRAASLSSFARDIAWIQTKRPPYECTSQRNAFHIDIQSADSGSSWSRLRLSTCAANRSVYLCCKQFNRMCKHAAIKQGKLPWLTYKNVCDSRLSAPEK